MIGDALAFASLHGGDSTGIIRPAQRITTIITEVELREIAMQMLLAAMLINTAHTALEHAKEAFRRIHMHIAARVFLRGMLHCFMRCKELFRTEVEPAFVGVQATF